MWLALAGIAISCPADVAAVDAALAAADTAWDQLDRDLLGRAAADARALTACLSEPLPVATVARLHRVQAFAAFVAGDEARARAAVAAARAVDPEGAFPPALVPAGHPLRALFVDSPPAAPLPVPTPARGDVVVDGVPDVGRPPARATVVWVADGVVIGPSAYLWPEDPLPGYPVLPAPPAAASARSPRAGLLVGAGAGALTSVTLAVLAGTTEAAWRTTTDLDEEARLYRRNHTLVGLSVGTGAVSLGVAALGFVW